MNRYEVLAQDPETGLSIVQCISAAAGELLVILITDDGTGIGTLDDGLIPLVLEFLRIAFSTNIAY